MYQIGEFSKITKLTIKALHYYEKEQILIAKEKTASGYRLYDESNYQKARLIKELKELQFTIAEIKEVLEEYQEENLYYYLAEKKEQIIKQQEENKKLILKINQIINEKTIKEEVRMEHQISIKEIPDIKVISVRFKGKYQEIGLYFGQLYKKAKGQSNGSPFALYYDEEYCEIADIEACLPVKSHQESKNIKGGQYLTTIHQGSYNTLHQGYKDLMDYAEAHNIKITTPSREIYLKGPGMIFKGNPKNYLTEIAIPIE